MSVAQRVICLVIGYIFGLFQTGYLYGRCNGIDIRKSGSGNSGTTNALRVMGKKAGAIVLAGDILKLCLACYTTTHIFNDGHFYNAVGQIMMLYTGFGVVLGHNYPFYLNFKGGKGIASTVGMLVILDWRLAIACLAIFLLTVVISHYVSLGSIFISIGFVVMWIVFNKFGLLPLAPEYQMETTIMVILWAALAIWRHRSNIKRLMAGNENKLF